MVSKLGVENGAQIWGDGGSVVVVGGFRGFDVEREKFGGDHLVAAQTGGGAFALSLYLLFVFQ